MNKFICHIIDRPAFYINDRTAVFSSVWAFLRGYEHGIELAGGDAFVDSVGINSRDFNNFILNEYNINQPETTLGEIILSHSGNSQEDALKELKRLIVKFEASK